MIAVVIRLSCEDIFLSERLFKVTIANKGGLQYFRRSPSNTTELTDMAIQADNVEESINQVGIFSFYLHIGDICLTHSEILDL